MLGTCGGGCYMGRMGEACLEYVNLAVHRHGYEHLSASAGQPVPGRVC